MDANQLELRKALYQKALSVSRLAAKQMRKYIFIVIGVMLYISFLVLSTVFYYPSYYACMIRCGTLWSLANASAQGIFFVFLVFYVIRQFMDSPGEATSELATYIDSFDKQLPFTLGICVTYLIVSYGILFFQCMDPIECDGCSAAKQTVFNSIITTQVNRTNPIIKELKAFYNALQKQTPRAHIAVCQNYYNDGYLNSIVGGQNPKQCAPYTSKTDGTPPTCVAADFISNMESADNSLYNKVTGDTVGAPMLSQFYIMTSCRTCVVQNQYDGYMSPVMITIALNGGARCLDFDITNYSYAVKSFPIVTNSRDYDKKNLQHNFVLFEDVMKTISRDWLQSKSATVKQDPLFLKLNFHAGATKDCMDQVAYLLQYYLNEQYGQHLLPTQLNYTNVDKFGGLGILPICAFFGKIVIMVYTPCASAMPSTLLGGMTNALVTQDTTAGSSSEVFQILQSKVVKNKNVGQRLDLVEMNRKQLSYVETSFHPYTLVGHQTCNQTTAVNDSITALLLNKMTINNDPLPAFATGCQFVAMNFQDISQYLKTYLKVFRYSSFILKPQSLWPTDIMTNIPLAPSSCNQEVEVSYVKKDSTSCIEVCVPKVIGDTTNASVLAENNIMTQEIYNNATALLDGSEYSMLKTNDQACARGDTYEEHSASNTDWDIIADVLTLEKRVFLANGN